MRSAEQHIVVHPDDLAPGEGILWSGKPDPLTSMFSRSGVALTAGVTLAASGFYFVIANSQSGPEQRWLGLLFVAFGILLFLPPIIEYRRASRTTYAITHQRLIIADNRRRSVKSIRLSAINEVDRLVRRGRTTLRIPTVLVSDGDGGQKVGYTELYGLNDPEHAYRLLTQSMPSFQVAT